MEALGVHIVLCARMDIESYLVGGMPKAGIGLRHAPVVDGAAEVVLVLVMLRIINVEADLVPGAGVVLSLDKLLVGLAPIPVDSHIHPGNAEGIKALVTNILDQVPPHREEG